MLPTEKSMISPCCGRIYHKDCIQNMGLTYGRHHLKCPLCSDKESFILEAERIGKKKHALKKYDLFALNTNRFRRKILAQILVPQFSNFT